MTPLRVLTSAFSCHPEGHSGLGAGEDILGWSLVRQISRFHNVWVLTYAKNRPAIEHALQQESISNIHFQYVDLPRWLRPLLRIQGGHQFYYYLWQIRAYWAARTLHKQHQYQLFHHLTYANDWMASFIGALLPVPYIRGPGGGAHRTPKGFEREYTLSGRLWERVRSIGQWLFHHDPMFIRGQNRACALLVCNRESMSRIPSHRRERAHFFPVNGISTEEISRTKPQTTNDGRFRVLSAGTLIRVKGFGLAVKAFREFAGRYPEAEFRIIGSGPEGTRLRSLVSRLRLESKVFLLPWMPREELLGHMASSDVFLFPSLRDGGGAVVIEAMSAGKPVVCLDVGGPGTHVSEEWGLKIPTINISRAISELAEALERLYLDEGLRHRLGHAAARRAEEFYSWDKLGNRLMEIYQNSLRSEMSS